MQKLLFQIQAWLKYQRLAKGRHGIHSPFVYQLYDEYITPKKTEGKQTTQAIETMRKSLLKDTRILEVEDFGAGLGGKIVPRIKRQVSEIAGSSARGAKFGALLYRLAGGLQAQNILEMGTNLGISSIYLMKGRPQAHMLTLEGSEAISSVAKENLNKFNLHPDIRIGEFSHSLENISWENYKPDFIFIDGNHRQNPTVTYFKFLMERAADQAVFIFDDIHWSPGMEAAWEIIRSDERVQISIDLYGMGICITGRKQAKEHFILRF